MKVVASPQIETRRNTKILQSILEEIRLLHKEMHFLFPQEELDEYAHPDRIKQSYKEAIKQYPPVSAV